MNLLTGTPGFGWTMYGLIGKGSEWFLGFSRVKGETMNQEDLNDILNAPNGVRYSQPEGVYNGEEQSNAMKQEYVKNLQCCGNCKHFTYESCPMREEIDKGYDGVKLYDYPDPNEKCDNWEFDARSHKERMVV